MKTNSSIITIILILILFSLNSCGGLFRKTDFISPKDGFIALDNEIILENGEVEQRMKYAYPRQLIVQKKGCKSYYSVWSADKYNGWGDIELFLIPIATGVVFKVTDNSDRPFLAGYVVNAWTVLAGLIDKINGPLVDRKFVYNMEEYPNLDHFKSHFKITNCKQDSVLFTGNDIKEELMDSTKTWMNGFIDELGVLETEELNITGYSDFNINADILTVNQVELPMRRQDKKITMTALQVKYEVLDKLGKVVLDTTIQSQSGQFINQHASEYSLHDALDYNVLYLFKSKGVQSLVAYSLEQNNTDYFNSETERSIVQNLTYQNLSNSIYKLETPYGFAPVVPITADGAAAISYHSYDLVDSLSIITPRGDTLKNRVVLEKSILKDYVIIQLNEPTPVHFPIANFLTNSDTLENGVAVQSVGYDIDYDALMMDRSSVFSEHTENEYPVYQIDASSHGMVYPAILSRDGYLLGFVTRSVKSRNVEGISFFRPMVNIP